MPSEEQILAFKEEAEQKRLKREESYARDGMSIRTYVLHVALHMEERISQILGHLLGIDITKSKVIGYRSNPISFNQKVQFLIEIGTIEGDRFKDFQLMMEIRNILMHQLDSRSMVECFRMIAEKEGTAALEHTQNMSSSLGDPIQKLINTIESSDQTTYTREQVIGVLKLAGFAVVKDFFASLEQERKKSYDDLMKKMGLSDPPVDRSASPPA